MDQNMDQNNDHEYEMELLRTLTELIMVAEDQQSKTGDHVSSFHAGEASAYRLIYKIIRDAMEG